jgi:hypothetical protein
MALNNGRIKQVTQITSKTTAVVAHSYVGDITTVALTDAAQGSFEFTVTNKFVKRRANIQITGEYAGTTGSVLVTIKSYARGSFIVKVRNVHATEALNAVAKFHYFISHD